MFEKTFKALSAPVRRDILNLLKKGRMSAGDIAAQFDMTQATVSYHLSKLKSADLVREEKVNNYIYYEENGKYNTVIAMTKNRDNIDKIEKAYNKDFKIVEYLLSDDEINNKLDEYDKKIGNTSDNNEIKLLVEELNGIYKGRDDIKMVKIS